ncbi:hypothetical protein [Neorhodopirellula lusitana]
MSKLDTDTLASKKVKRSAVMDKKHAEAGYRFAAVHYIRQYHQ